MNIKHETSVGAVICKTERNAKRFLLVYSVKNREWSFPKGHVEPGETEKETAVREIFEETGIKDPVFVDGFRCACSYVIKPSLRTCPDSIIEKNVIYYLCLTDSDFVNPDNGEISECKWASYDEASDILAHGQQKEILCKANKYLEGNIK